MRLALIIVGLVLASTAAAEPSRYAVQGSRLIIDTNIPFGNQSSVSLVALDVNEMYGCLADNPGIRTVVLTSGGGSMAAAEAMAGEIARLGLDTEAQGRCESACIQVFLGGKHRRLSKGSVLGFHRSYLTVPMISNRFRPSETHNAFDAEDVADQYDAGEDAALKHLKFMRDHGVDVRFWLKAMTHERGDMWYASRAELLAAGVITEP